MIETMMNTSPCFDLESFDSKDVIEIPSMDYLCSFNASSLPDQSQGFLGHVSLADKVSVKKNSESVDTSGVPSGSQSRTKLVDLNSEADECMNEIIPSDSMSYSSLGGCGPSYRAGSSNTEVVLYPDYVIYKDNYYLGLKLTFSTSHIQINYATPFENHEALNIELAVDDLVNIKSQLFQSIVTIMMKLSVRSSNTYPTSHVDCASGIEELTIVVADFNWSLTRSQITSLNLKYSEIWKIATEVDAEGNEYFSPGPTSYFPNFEMPFNEVVYPKGEPDAVTLSKRDVDLLRPDTYINDNIIDFYIQYLKGKIPRDERSRFHFFNSFFFRKLADLDKDPSSACDGKAAFKRVRTWTRKVNLFQKDYIFIPVNFNFHWSLLVICHPGEVVNFNDNELDKSPRVPCILHMDSVKGFHSGLKNLMQSYLCEEWKERQKNTTGEDLSSRVLNMRFLPAAVPQQQNNYDCGLFLLHYLELFLEEATLNFNPLKLTKYSNFLNLNWFQPAEAYLKRTLIQRLIFELVENNGVHEGFSSDDSGDYRCLESSDNSTGSHCHFVNGESSTSHYDKEIEMTVLPSSPVLRELFETGAAVGSSGYDLNGSMFPMKEVTDLTEKEISRPTISADNVRVESSRGVSSCALSDSDDDIEIIGNFPVQHDATSLHWELPDINGSADVNIPVYSFMELPPPSKSSYGENHLSNQETPAIPFRQVSDAVNNNIRYDSLQIIDNMEADTCEEQATKKRRLLPLLGEVIEL